MTTTRAAHKGAKPLDRIAVSSATRMALLAVLSASVDPVDGRRNEMAPWIDYYSGRRGGPRAHPTGQPSAMAPQRRGAVAAPARDPRCQPQFAQGPPLARRGKGRENHAPPAGRRRGDGGAAPTPDIAETTRQKDPERSELGHSSRLVDSARSGIPGLEYLGSRSPLDAARQASDACPPAPGHIRVSGPLYVSE